MWVYLIAYNFKDSLGTYSEALEVIVNLVIFSGNYLFNIFQIYNENLLCF